LALITFPNFLFTISGIPVYSVHAVNGSLLQVFSCFFLAGASIIAWHSAAVTIGFAPNMLTPHLLQIKKLLRFSFMDRISEALHTL